MLPATLLAAAARLLLLLARFLLRLPALLAALAGLLLLLAGLVLAALLAALVLIHEVLLNPLGIKKTIESRVAFHTQHNLPPASARAAAMQ